MLFILLLIIFIATHCRELLTQLESQMVSNFQEQIQLQVGFLKNNVQPILAKDATDEAKMSEISQLLQDYPTGNSIVEIRIMDMQGYILGTTNQTQQSVVGNTFNRSGRSTSCCVEYRAKAITSRKAKRVIGNTVSPIDPVNTASGIRLGLFR